MRTGHAVPSVPVATAGGLVEVEGTGARVRVTPGAMKSMCMAVFGI